MQPVWYGHVTHTLCSTLCSRAPKRLRGRRHAACNFPTPRTQRRAEPVPSAGLVRLADGPVQANGAHCRRAENDLAYAADAYSCEADVFLPNKHRITQAVQAIDLVVAGDSCPLRLGKPQCSKQDEMPQISTEVQRRPYIEQTMSLKQ